MEIDSLSFLLGAISICVAYIVGAIFGAITGLWKDGHISKY